MTHPSIYSFVFILICLQMLQPSGAGNRWNNVPHHTIKPATQFSHFSASSAVSVCVSCSPYRFQVICQKGGREQEVSLPRKPFLKELGSTARSSWPLECSGSENGAELEGRMGGHLRHSLSPPALPLVIRSLTQEALEPHYPLLTVHRAAGWWCCSWDPAVLVLDV